MYKAKLEFFFGTGGVGKSSVCAARAIQLGIKGKKVLVIGIDPSRRIKDLFSPEAFRDYPISLEVFNPRDFYLSLIDKHHQKPAKEIQSRLLNLLISPHGGFHELFSLVYIQQVLENDQYEYILIDTAPGAHFLDFLAASEKLKAFFHQSFLDIFLNNEDTLWKKILATGTDKLLQALKMVTGDKFVNEFISAIQEVLSLKESFDQAQKLQSYIRSEQSQVNWYMICSTDQDKVAELLQMKELAQKHLPKAISCILNRSRLEEIELFYRQHPQKSQQESYLGKLLKFYQQREFQVRQQLHAKFDNVYYFCENTNYDPRASLSTNTLFLSKQWSNVIKDS